MHFLMKNYVKKTDLSHNININLQAVARNTFYKPTGELWWWVYPNPA